MQFIYCPVTSSLLTISMERSPSESNSRSASQAGTQKSIHKSHMIEVHTVIICIL
jgi:hypothetical protein